MACNLLRVSVVCARPKQVDRAKEEYMRNAKLISSCLSVVWLFGALLGCTPGPNGADDIADEVDKALDPDPDYVDQPAATPRKPQ
jgi:hypothetical protein